MQNCTIRSPNKLVLVNVNQGHFDGISKAHALECFVFPTMLSKHFDRLHQNFISLRQKIVFELVIEKCHKENHQDILTVLLTLTPP